MKPLLDYETLENLLADQPLNKLTIPERYALFNRINEVAERHAKDAYMRGWNACSDTFKLDTRIEPEEVNITNIVPRIFMLHGKRS